MLGLSLCVPCALTAQAPAMGPEFQVNSYTTGYQNAPQVASDADGNFVVTWDGVGPGLGGYGVFARRFDNTGTPLATEFVVNGFTAAHGASVAWQSGQDGSGDGVYAETYDSSGSPVSGLIPVSSYTTGNQGHARVAMDSAGGFVVVWDSEPDQDGDGLGVFAQRFDSSGSKAGSEFLVNTETAGDQYLPDLAMAPDGAFVVVWMTKAADPGDPGEIRAQRYDNTGAAQGTEIPVNQSTAGAQQGPRVAMDASGNFVVAWSSLDQPLGDHEAIVRRFDASGNALGGEIAVADASSTEQVVSSVGMDAAGGFTVVWDSHGPFTVGYLVNARRYDAAGRPLDNGFSLDTQNPLPDQHGGAISIDSRGGFVVVWGCTPDHGACPDGSDSSVAARRGGFPAAGELSVDARPSGGTSNANGVLEAGERVAVDAEWINASTSPLPLTGAASDIAGPAGPTYSIDDASADYGSVAAGGSSDCYDATADCFEISVSGTRPAPHWDVTFDEALSTGVTKTWTLHVGESFSDVPTTHSFYGFIENIFHNGITGGCGGGGYCPGNAVTRAQMAVFLLKAEHGATYAPPACAGVFGDVACPSAFADWIEQLAAEGITGGCGGGDYCPDSPVTRAQMAVFLLKAEHGADYAPPTCAGVFGDVACPSLFADWIERLADEAITGGCGGGNYCPTSPNTRGQMAVFLVKTFELQLYGP
jgi:hypothetical protein